MKRLIAIVCLAALSAAALAATAPAAVPLYQGVVGPGFTHLCPEAIVIGSVFTRVCPVVGLIGSGFTGLCPVVGPVGSGLQRVDLGSNRGDLCSQFLQPPLGLEVALRLLVSHASLLRRRRRSWGKRHPSYRRRGRRVHRSVSTG